MRAERNTHSRTLIELQDEITELRRKLQMLVRGGAGARGWLWAAVGWLGIGGSGALGASMNPVSPRIDSDWLVHGDMFMAG